MRTGRHQIGDAAPVARALQNIVRYQRDHLGMVELHAALKPAARDHRRHSQQQLVLLARGQVHLSNSTRAASPGPLAGCRARARSEEHTSELQSLMRISSAVFCLKKKTEITSNNNHKSH